MCKLSLRTFLFFRCVSSFVHLKAGKAQIAGSFISSCQQRGVCVIIYLKCNSFMRGINHGPRTRHHVPHENIEIDRERENVRVRWEKLHLLTIYVINKIEKHS